MNQQFNPGMNNMNSAPPGPVMPAHMQYPQPRSTPPPPVHSAPNSMMHSMQGTGVRGMPNIPQPMTQYPSNTGYAPPLNNYRNFSPKSGAFPPTSHINPNIPVSNHQNLRPLSHGSINAQRNTLNSTPPMNYPVTSNVASPPSVYNSTANPGIPSSNSYGSSNPNSPSHPPFSSPPTGNTPSVPMNFPRPPASSYPPPPPTGPMPNQNSFNTGGPWAPPAPGADPSHYTARYSASLPSPMPPRNIYGSMVDDKYKPVDIAQETTHVMEKKHDLEPLSFHGSSQNGPLTPPNQKNCSPDVFRCTLNAIPNSQTLLNKVKLPLGLIIHPFKDLSSLPVISAGTIVRCKRCRAYINPFVEYLDERRWRCNLCFVVNDVTEEFLHHPVTKTYGEPHTRPECTNSTLEFIAPQEYMVRPPQPAVYMFLFDVSHSALETGYLQVVCERLLKNLDYLPGDKRTKIGFITFDGNLHFYKMTEGASQPVMMLVSDLDDVFLPIPDSLLVNLHEKKDLIIELLEQLPKLHCISENVIKGESEVKNCLGPALQAAFKLVSAFGGRITVFQQTMPTAGPGALSAREDPNSRAGNASTASINPSTDFYKKMALEFSGRQVAADFFFLNSQYLDIATVSCASRFSAGDLHYYPNLHVVHNPLQAERLARDLDRYLTRKIGFEAVMRIRCTKGMAINTFHGNFFVRSTDLLALANISPDAGFGLNLCIEDDISSLPSICIQAALLYTSSKGERRIRVHTMKFPVVKSAADVFNAVDSDAVVVLLSKMAVDRSVAASLSDARDALLNAVIDALKAYRECAGAGNMKSAILVPKCMKTYPLAISCLLKHPALRAGVSTRLDDRVFSMIDLKIQPMAYVLQSIHPNLYRVDNLSEQESADFEGTIVPQPRQLPLSAESINRQGVYLLDTGWYFYLYVTPHANKEFLANVIGVRQFSDIEQPLYALPDLDNPMSGYFDSFIDWLRDQRPYHAAMQVVRSDSREHYLFMQYLRLDKTESSMSFQEFLQHVNQQLSK